MTAENIKEGDIFRWRYKDEKPEDRGEYRRYHCKSMIAVFEKGALHDTYWCSSSDGWLDPEKVVLDFQGNMHEMKQIPEGERVFYRPEDIVDMNHPNNSRAPVYVKVGAVRDPESMKYYFGRQLERADRDIASAHRRIQECQEALADIERGNVSRNFFIYS